jgi:CRP-like cAMP-binding protein
VLKSSTCRRHFLKRGAFHDALLSYYHYLLVQISYLSICNQRHGIERRLIRWLLMLQDRTGSRDLKFTQDSIAGVMGTRRATISVAAALQEAGLISYTPGAITIESRKALLKAACPCYRIIRSFEEKRR